MEKGRQRNEKMTGITGYLSFLVREAGLEPARA